MWILGLKGITSLMGGHVFYVTNTFHDSALSEELLGKLPSILRLSSHW